MKKLVVLIALMLCNIVLAEDPAPAAGNDEEEIIRWLENSGALDRAVDRALKRFVLRQQQTQREQEEKNQAQQSVLAKNARNPDPAKDYVFGSPGAEVTIIEYSDYECPFCKTFHGTPQEVVKRLGGKANLVWRHFPLEFHNPAAQREAEASICAAKQGSSEAFWKYTDAVMARTGSNGKGLPPVKGDKGDSLLALARELKLDGAAFQKCLSSGGGKERVADDMRDGSASGINGTPGVIIRNNKTGTSLFLSGTVPVDILEAKVRGALSGD